MIEGQEDVTWPQWLKIDETCERRGIEVLFRSDHYRSVYSDDERGGLNAWATLSASAARTSTLRLGTLMSPVTFRAPSVLAKMAVTVDHVSQRPPFAAAEDRNGAGFACRCREIGQRLPFAAA